VLPPVLFNGRVTTQPTELGGHRLPTGTEVLASIYHTHHLPELFPHPDRFDPGRWETIAPSAFAYGPFSSGARRCLGASFAQLEIKIVLAMVLQRFRLQCPPSGRVDRSGLIVLAPRGGLPMVVHRQDRRVEEGVGGLRGNIREMVELPA
jgi:cytochrome P450